MIRIGSRGDAVYYWQTFLANQGYNVAVDGIFGQGTHNATVMFQQYVGLSADGIVGTNTYNVAYNYGYSEGC